MKKFWALLMMLALMLTLLPAAALADGETVEIKNSAELMDAITNQKPGQTWNIASGVYDIGRNTITAGGQPNWYFPIVKDGITIKGAGARARARVPRPSRARLSPRTGIGRARISSPSLAITSPFRI